MPPTKSERTVYRDQASTALICRIIYDTGIPWHVLTDEELTPRDVLAHLIDIAKTRPKGCPWLR